MESHILHQNSTFTVFLVDIPRSIELVQGFQHSSSLRIVSTPPLEVPFLTPEPKSLKARIKVLENKESQSIKDLILKRYVEFALEEIRHNIDRRKWCLDRVTNKAVISDENVKISRDRTCPSQDYHTFKELLSLEGKIFGLHNSNVDQHISSNCLIQNDKSISMVISLAGRNYLLPPLSTCLLGTIQNTIGIFNKKNIKIPQFSIITADPPWPNRSAKRNGDYLISNKYSEIENLLLSIPIRHHLTDNGIVAIWVTNKLKFQSLVLKIFKQWNINVIEEWIWLKTTVLGEPIFPITSLWRKPYELLLVGRKVAKAESIDINLKKRVLVGVPDLHSRKPNLKELLEKVFGFEHNNYMGLEIFARNLTTGWWSWGCEALMFQEERFWNNVDDN
ncbi:putative mt-a70 family [Erysiphe necator]|uniref:Putative mt-a70 family n=1 Tax=Uncinula necator TaxID=52586 RepID=A0A0B1NYH3_UNCNE|nr:putative mt-a70 family [Erysiphe necator]